MLNRSISRGFKVLTGLFIATLVGASPAASAQQSNARQVEALADLAARILSCSVHPCLGESEKDVRRLLRGKIVSDDFFYYSDLSVSYPSVANVLRGLVEWDFDDGLGMVSMKIVDFHVAPSLLVAELDRVLSGCEMEQDEEGGDYAVEENGETGSSSELWSCEAEQEGSADFLVEVYFAPGLVLFEMGS